MLTRAAGHLLPAITSFFEICLVWEALVRAGRPAGRWSGSGAGTGGLERHAVRWLTGLIVLGTAFMATALTGLCRPGVLLPLAAALAMCGDPGRRPRVLPLIGSCRRASVVAQILCAVALLALLPAVWSPTLDQDALLYHFGVPWQALQTGRVPLDMVPFVYHHPLPADFANALPLVVGGERLAKLLSLAALAVGLIFALGAATASGPAGWTAPLLLLPVFYVPWLATTGKNDLVSAGLCLAGALAWRQRRSIAGAGLLGAAVAAKLSCAPIAVAWIACHPPRRLRGAIGAAAALALPVLPWLVKAWLATANPVFPLYWRLCASPFWDARNQASMDVYDQWLHGAEHLSRIPGIWLREMWSHDPAWLLALPALAVAGGWRVAATIALAGAGSLHVGRMTRYILPAIWLTGFEVAQRAAAVPGRRGGRLRAVLAGFAILRFGWLTDPAGWRHPADPRAAGTADPYAALREAGAHLIARGDRRVLATAEWRTHLVPGRILYDGHLGETPIVWARVHDSTDDERLRIRFRQLGTRTVLYNVVSAEWMAAHDEPFRWDAAMIRRYHDFCRDRMRPAVAPRIADRTTGCYWILNLDLKPGPVPRGPAPFMLPGAEVTSLAANRDARAGRLADSVREYRALLAPDPDVGEYRSGLGRALLDERNWKEAYAAFLPAARRGYIDGWNLWGLGAACYELGRFDEAETWFRKALGTYDTKDENRVNLAAVYAARGTRALRRRRTADAVSDLGRGDSMIGMVTPNDAAPWERDRRDVADALADLRRRLAPESARR